MELGGRTFQTGALSVFDQLLVARKLSVVLPMVGAMLDEENQEKDPSLLALVMLSALNDVDSQVVVSKCLSAVTVVQEEGPARLMVDGALMFNDVEMPNLLKLVAAVIKEQLGDFFGTALSDSQDGASQE